MRVFSLKTRDILVSACIVLITTASSFADDTFQNAFKVVGSYGSTTEKTSFGWNEKPYIYSRMPVAGIADFGSFWNDPENASRAADVFGVTLENDNQEVWYSFTDEQWFTGTDEELPYRKTGEWSVLGYYFYSNGAMAGDTGFGGCIDPSSCDVGKFVVTPEPVSMVLFGLGGLPLAARFLRKKQTV